MSRKPGWFERKVIPILVLLVLPGGIACIMILGSGCEPRTSFAAPESKDIVAGNVVYHFEAYPLGGGGEYMSSDIDWITKTDDGVVWVTITNKNHTSKDPIIVDGKTMMDGHKAPGYIVPEWYRKSDPNYDENISFDERYIEPPAEKIPDDSVAKDEKR